MGGWAQRGWETASARARAALTGGGARWPLRSRPPPARRRHQRGTCHLLPGPKACETIGGHMKAMSVSEVTFLPQSREARTVKTRPRSRGCVCCCGDEHRQTISWASSGEGTSQLQQGGDPSAAAPRAAPRSHSKTRARPAGPPGRGAPSPGSRRRHPRAPALMELPPWPQPIITHCTHQGTHCRAPPSKRAAQLSAAAPARRPSGAVPQPPRTRAPARTKTNAAPPPLIRKPSQPRGKEQDEETQQVITTPERCHARSSRQRRAKWTLLGLLRQIAVRTTPRRPPGRRRASCGMSKAASSGSPLPVSAPHDLWERAHVC